MRLLRHTRLLLAISLVLVAILPAQTLAHKNWAGNGFTVEPWWKNAIFYQVDPLTLKNDAGSSGFGGVTARLDYLQSLHVDAILLSPLKLDLQSQAPFNPADGTVEDFDHLQQEASRRKIRLVVDLPQSRSRQSEQDLAAARFWLSRGVSGLRLSSSDLDLPDAADRGDRVRALRHLLASFSGDRVLMADALPNSPATVSAGPRHHRRARGPESAAINLPQLVIHRALAQTKSWDVGTLPAALFSSQATQPGAVLITQPIEQPSSQGTWTKAKPEDAIALARIVGTALFLGLEQPMIVAGQESGIKSGSEASDGSEDDAPNSLLGWYRKLSQLRQAEATLHGGTITRIDTGYPEVLAWVRRGEHPADQPVLVVCNQSARPLVISVVEPLRRLGLSADSGLRTLAASAEGLDVSKEGQGIALPAWGVYVGELRQPGLEAVAVPAPRSHSRRR